MKKSILFVLLSLVVIMSISSVSAVCSLSAIMLNQDPYPANPGDYVKVVFQVNGTGSPDCANLAFRIVPEYPFSLDAGDSGILNANGVIYVSTDYVNYVLVPYKLRIDENAMDGDNKIRFEYSGGKTTITNWAEDFNIHIEDTKTDFEVSIQDYSKTGTGSVTFGLVNIGKRDAEAVVLEVPKQDNFDVKGNTNVIIGSLSANDDTTAIVKGIPKEGEITVRISYNDANSFRRTVEKKITFTNGNRLNAQGTQPYRGGYFYLFWIIFIALVIYLIYRYRKSKSAKNNKNLMLLKK